MAYFIEFGQDPSSAFYAEIEVYNVNNGAPLPGDGIDHRFNVLGVHDDYGEVGLYGYTIASNVNGRITAPAPGVLAIAIPPRAFFGPADPDTGVWYGGFQTRRRSLRYSLIAVPANPDFAATLATGTISFGDRLMPCARVRLGAYPLYPNSLTAAFPDPTVSQYFRALATVQPNPRATLDAAIPADPDNPSRIILSTTQTVPVGGAFEMLVQITLSLTAGQMAAIRTLALSLPA